MDIKACPHCGHEFDTDACEQASVGSLFGGGLPHATCPECKLCIGCAPPTEKITVSVTYTDGRQVPFSLQTKEEAESFARKFSEHETVKSAKLVE